MIRPATAADADALLALQRRLDGQSSFMLLEPDEREQDPRPLANRLAAQEPGGSFDLVFAGPDGVLGGWVSVDVPPFRRAAHTGMLVLGVARSHAGRGIGGSLLDAAATEAERRALTRLELTVMTDNVRAYSLYRRHGFAVEGVKRGSIRRDGAHIDEYAMSRLLAGHADERASGD